MSASRAYRPADTFRELDTVRTRASIGTDDGILPSGSLGTIVIAHRDGRAFEVEFVDPIEALVTLNAEEIERA